MAKGIFVSYRRDDTAHATGRIADALANRFGRERVFVDVDSVAPGEDFVRKIEQTIASSDVFLAIIGPNWLSAQTRTGERRIDFDTDFIRLEVTAALKAGLKIVPVLVDGAEMPRAEDLSDDLRQLVRHNAVEVKHNTFARDIDALLDRLTPPNPIARLNEPRLLAACGAIFAAIALLFTLIYSFNPGSDAKPASSASLADRDGKTERAEMWITDIWQTSERSADGKLIIKSDFPYRERMLTEGLIDGLRFNSVVFYETLPTLLVQISNPTDEMLSVSELNFEVLSAKPDLRAVPVLRENPLDFRIIRLSNEGWGDIQDAVLTIETLSLPKDDMFRGETFWRGNVAALEPCAQTTDLIELEPQPISVSNDGRYRSYFDLAPILPEGFDPARQYFCATGKLSYQDPVDGDVTLNFRTRVSNERPLAAVAPLVLATYDLYLDPDRAGYTASITALQDIAPGTTASIEVKVHTSRSSTFELIQSVRLADGARIDGEEIAVEIILPKHQSRSYALNELQRKSLDEDLISQFDPENWVMEATYDPQARDDHVIILSNEMDRQSCASFIDQVALPLFEASGAPEKGIYVRTGEDRFLCSHSLETDL